MHIDASSGRNHKRDVRYHCRRLTIRADTDEEAAFVAAIYRAIVWRERIVIDGDVVWFISEAAPLNSASAPDR